jgi:hypothetical protein
MLTKLKAALSLAVLLSAAVAPQIAHASDWTRGYSTSHRDGDAKRASAHAHQMIREAHPRQPETQPRWIDNPASQGG